MRSLCKWKRLKNNEVNEGVWDRIDPILIENYPWDENGYMPKVEVRFFYTESRLYLHYTSYEKEIRAIHRETSRFICCDSCIEFFFNPDPDKDDRYFNFEINPIGTLLLGIGSHRDDREVIKGLPENFFKIKTSVDGDKVEEYKGEFWTVEFSIPYTFIEEYYGNQDFIPGKVMRGNFQKCGDETRYPHFGCWNWIGTREPDFHQSRYFGEFIL